MPCLQNVASQKLGKVILIALQRSRPGFFGTFCISLLFESCFTGLRVA